jgi:ribosomal-protein-alanine N-acetyltransferase
VSAIGFAASVSSRITQRADFGNAELLLTVGFLGRIEAMLEVDQRVRWMMRRDMPEVQSIEESVFEFAWSEKDFIRCLRQLNCIGMVAELNDKVVGYMIYELHKHRLHLLNFAVSPSCRRIGIGRAMIEKLIGKLSLERRNRIHLEVRETNLDAQLFFRSVGFRAESVVKDFWKDSNDDAYVFVYRVRS